MAALRRLACLLFGHSRWPGIDPDLSLVIHCPRCCRLYAGRLAVRR